MTKIPSVEKPRCKRLVENGKAVCNCILDCHLHDWRQKDHIIALLTELRDSGLLEEKEICEHRPQDSCDTECYHQEERVAHNTLARAIKAHINNLINPTGL